MNILEVVGKIPRVEVSKLSVCEKFVDTHGDVVGVSFEVSDSYCNRFCFTLSKDTFNSAREFGRVFASEIKNSVHPTEVSLLSIGDLKGCVRLSDCIEKRETNFDWVLEPQSQKQNCVLVDGGKYPSDRVVVFDVVSNVMDALEACARV